ncbi:MAG TPA: discoidin domain-containing protein [Candidatus Hydrogenedentes bacterium]|nr:discoidin domain-containing protein [Candidatus Hydrogenedentota bacterium]
MIRWWTVAFLTAGLAFPAAAERNVALSKEGAVAVADSEYLTSPYREGGEVAVYVNDGKWVGKRDKPESNRWHSAVAKPHPHWVWIKFRQPARITRVVIHRADVKVYPVDFTGEYSPDDGETLQPLFQVSGHQMDERTFTIEKSFEPVVTDNFRVRIDRSSYKEFPNSAQLSEVEVFGEFVEGGPAPAPDSSAASLPPPVLEPTQEKDLVVTRRDTEIEFRSPWLRLAASLERPRITALCWDSLGEGHLDKNLLKPDAKGGARVETEPLFPAVTSDQPVISQEGNIIRYDMPLFGNTQARWEIRVEAKNLRMALSWAVNKVTLFRVSPGVQFAFDLAQTPVAPLVNPKSGIPAPLPCLLHASDYGSLLIQRSDGGAAEIIAKPLRGVRQWNARLVECTETRADGLYSTKPGVHRWETVFSVENPSPLPDLVREEPRLHTLPRHWLDVFQYRPDIGILSNNIVSDNAVFCMFTFTDPAVFTPPLPGGVEAIQTARESLDRYFAGAPGYGVGVDDFMDTDPALLISAWDVIMVTGDLELLERWLPHLERYAAHLEKMDHDGNGLPEGPRSGNHGDQLEDRFRTGNWWDCINFGHEDAYVCALAYRAFRGMADLERLAKRSDPAEHFEQAAEKIHASYYSTFFNPETGILAGWKSRDGKLHDYWFVFVNGMAIACGLVPEKETNKIVDRIEAKIKEVGYTRFDLGLPGNLIPVAKNDYVSGTLGAPKNDDGHDSFGSFENGGATACYAYFYIQALYQLGRRAEADRILWPMMQTYAAGGFQNGVGNGGEWRKWDGTPSGYEGFLADAYYTQMAVFTGYYGLGLHADGFAIERWSPLRGKEVPLGLKYMGAMVQSVGP